MAGMSQNQTILNDAYLPGPDPILTPPPLADAVAAEEALTMALLENSMADKIVTGITPAQAETLLAWMVYQTRQGLLQLRTPTEDAPAFSPRHAAKLCREANGMIGRQSQELGIPTRHHQLREFTEGKYYGHAFAVLMIPILENDNATVTPYLVDTSFRQFFDHDLNNDRYWTNLWAKEITKTIEGRNLADAILCDGFTKLTPENADLYVRSADIDRYLGVPVLAPHYPDLFLRLTSHQTTLPAINEVKHILLPTPIMAACEAQNSINDVAANERLIHHQPQRPTHKK